MAKVLSIFLAAFILISSAGFTTVAHYCGNTLEKVLPLLPGENLGCQMNSGQMKSACGYTMDGHNKAALENNCCRNQFLTIKTGNKVLPDKPAVPINFHAIALLFPVIIQVFVPFDTTVDLHLLYKPPRLELSRQLSLLQSFLI